jgi:hypothetical protein
MTECIDNKASQCFTFLQPLIKNNTIDPYDAFLFGHSLGKHGTQNINFIVSTMEKILILKKAYDVSQRTLHAIYCLMLEQNWSVVGLVSN